MDDGAVLSDSYLKVSDRAKNEIRGVAKDCSAFSIEFCSAPYFFHFFHQVLTKQEKTTARGAARGDRAGARAGGTAYFLSITTGNCDHYCRHLTLFELRFRVETEFRRKKTWFRDAFQERNQVFKKKLDFDM
ncbi:MAG: hypothetical protein OXN17_13535, partial [Candidatus Poribacteria bacterium]|nr:hypothetical protein [Candidatus Poribacteria bacterium]